MTAVLVVTDEPLIKPAITGSLSMYRETPPRLIR
jgi:hypothetical protein